MPASFSRLLFIAVVVSLFTGCGAKSAKKGGGMTVQQRLEKAEKEPTPEKQAVGYLRAARFQLASGDTSGARDSARIAFDRLKEDGDANTFAPRLVDVGGFLAELGDKKPAKEAILRAAELSAGVADAVRRTKILADAGAVAGEKGKGIGDAALAKDLLTQAITMADSVEERFRAEALAAVALGCTRAGQADAAAELVGRLEESAKALEEPRAKAEGLAAAASVRSETGKKDEAAALLPDAAADDLANGPGRHAYSHGPPPVMRLHGPSAGKMQCSLACLLPAERLPHWASHCGNLAGLHHPIGPPLLRRDAAFCPGRPRRHKDGFWHDRPPGHLLLRALLEGDADAAVGAPRAPPSRP